MAKNPAHGAITPKAAGTLRMNGQNELSASSKRRRNNFPQPFENYMTLKFGEVRPFFKANGVGADTLKMSNNHVLYSYTLQSPMLSNLKMYKDYFYIPMKAILPHSWEAWNNTPVQGDDVPDDVYCNFDFLELFNSIRGTLGSIAAFELGSTGTGHYTTWLFCRMIAMLMEVYSVGGLVHQLGICNMSSFFVSSENVPGISQFAPKYSSIDEWLEVEQKTLFTTGSATSITISMLASYNDLDTAENRISFKIFDDNGTFSVADFRNWLNFIRRYPLSCMSSSANAANEAFKNMLCTIFTTKFNSVFSLPASAVLVDISPLIAYQMTGAQFYVNDAIDVVYNSFDWMQEQWNNVYTYFFDDGDYSYFSDVFFSYNGHQVEYDAFSQKIISFLLISDFYQSGNESQSSSSNWKFVSNVNYLWNLFIPFNSLRYGDYFTGSRVSPLAVGDVTAPVVANEVSAVDMTHATLWQRFLQKINKIGPTPWLQQAAVYGRFPSSVDEMPRFISRTVCSIGKQEIENTANEQGLLQTNLRSSEGQFGFNVDIDEDCIVLGLVSFDCPRVYVNVTDRLSFVKDRYDKFQPDFQNVGDQAILLPEINISKVVAGDSDSTDYGQSVFAWTLRNTEYKQRINIASGAFVGDTFLPSWAFTENNSLVENINSDFIRNHNEDFDRFYKSLANFTTAGYFHFIVKFNNNFTAVRAMEDEPTILF